MNNNSDSEKLSNQIKSVLDNSLNGIDEDTRYQLQLRRAEVLNGKAKSGLRANWPMFGGVTVFASIAALAVFLVAMPTQYSELDANVVTDVDAMFFEADVNMELYEQYDFYVWLVQQESNG